MSRGQAVSMPSPESLRIRRVFYERYLGLSGGKSICNQLDCIVCVVGSPSRGCNSISACLRYCCRVFPFRAPFVVKIVLPSRWPVYVWSRKDLCKAVSLTERLLDQESCHVPWGGPQAIWPAWIPLRGCTEWLDMEIFT